MPIKKRFPNTKKHWLWSAHEELGGFDTPQECLAGAKLYTLDHGDVPFTIRDANGDISQAFRIKKAKP